MTEILTKKNSPEVSAIIVTDPVQITAYGLGDGDCITFLKVQFEADRDKWTRNGCSIIRPSELRIGNAEEYKIGVCQPSISKCRNTIIINRPGIYQPNMKDVSSTDVVIEADKLDISCCPSPEELGIEPCGCSCHDEPTEPLPIIEEGCGGAFTRIAWMYGPYDNKDPKATVEVTGCDGTIAGYIYPTAGPGHTIPVKSCGDGGTKIVGFASNNSSAASQMFNSECGHSGCNSKGGNQGGVNVIIEEVKIADMFGDLVKGG